MSQIFSCYFCLMGHKMDFLFYLLFLFYITDDRLFFCNSLSKICLLISQLVMTPMSTYIFNTSLQMIHQLEKKKAVIMRKWCHHKYATVDKILRLLNGEGELILKTSKNQGQYPIMHCHGSCAWLLCQYVD